MLFNSRDKWFLMNTFAILIMGVISLSLFVSTASAQDPPSVGGLPVPIDSSELFASLMTSNLLWMIPAAAAGVVVFKLKFKRN